MNRMNRMNGGALEDRRIYHLPNLHDIILGN